MAYHCLRELILPPTRHQSVLLLLPLSYMLHSAAVCEAPKMGSLILTTCILSSLVSMGYSITCFVCRTETEATCTGEERSCPKDYVCASTSTITIMDGMQSKVFTRSCERRNACGVIGTIGYQRGQVKTATSCCYTDSCFPSTPALPLDEARKNGLTCSSCTAHDSAWCMSKEKIDCTGQENKCIFMNHVYSGAKHSKNAFRGCGTKAICDLGSQSHNYGGVSLRTEITCSNLGSTIHSGVFILLVAVAISSKFLF
ncbi:phospholipase A2 inhibitor and Ly6/PLAUR domain-containing protein-like isoform X1 [Ranitomeya imitator]|uniref:phospholipase A2 inhibitor and Ly6/PLAUR domain-containing protein-like isoform X1 n=1 Tax=Ranitomeya imitator TaxID=111125 RepID=UPI0037E99DE3